MQTYIIAANINAVNGNQSGAVTHHHDQVATTPHPPNFKVRKIKNNNDPKLIDEFVFLSDILFIYYIFKDKISFCKYQINIGISFDNFLSLLCKLRLLKGRRLQVYLYIF